MGVILDRYPVSRTDKIMRGQPCTMVFSFTRRTSAAGVTPVTREPYDLTEVGGWRAQVRTGLQKASPLVSETTDFALSTRDAFPDVFPDIGGGTVESVLLIPWTEDDTWLWLPSHCLGIESTDPVKFEWLTARRLGVQADAAHGDEVP